MLTLNDGRNELWQWDTGRKLTVDADCSQVHFSNKVFGRSIDVDVVGGVAIIPDILLQTDKELNVWAFVGTAENGYTKISKTFRVNRRNKPADYVFTPPEQTTLGEILERLNDIESAQDPDAIKNAVDDYLANNPIKVEETDPTVPDWAKKPSPPDVKIPDKLPNPYTLTFTGAVNASYDGSSAVEIKIPDSGGNPDYVGLEPADDDMPKVFLTGTKPTTKEDVLAEMEYVSKTDRFHAYLEIKCQGTSSMSWPKKNFTVKLYSDESRETKLKMDFKDWNHPGNKFVLKANYIDHSHARNIVSARLWDEIVRSRPDYESLPEEMRNSPRNGAVDGFPIKVYYNGTYEGIYTWNIGKDDWMWGMDEDNPNHVLLCAETNTDGTYRETPCNFRKLWSGVDETDWSVEVGTNSDAVKTALNNLIQFVMDNDGEDFRNGIGQYLDIQSAIDYYIFQYDICGLDGLAKNMLLGSYDCKLWHCGAYDLDSTFGLWWNGSKFVAATYACPEDYQEEFSLLWERIESNYIPELKGRQTYLRKTVLSYSNMVTHFERFMDVIGLDLYAEDLTIYPGIPSGSTNNIKQIRNYIRDRQAYVDAEFAAMSAPVPCEGISLNKTNVVFTGQWSEDVTATVIPDGCTDSVIWVTSNPAVAVISVEGNVCTVEAIANGNTTITATCGEYSASCSVAVSGIAEPVPCTGITLDKAELTFNGEGSQTIVATVTPSDTTDKVVWSSDAPGVAKVENGVVTAIGNGSANITATCGNYSASCSVEVSGVAAAMLYSLPEAKTFNGTSDYVDTGIKLFDTPKDFTIIFSADLSQSTDAYDAVFHCLKETSPNPGLTLMWDNSKKTWFLGGNPSGTNFVDGIKAETVTMGITAKQGVITGAKYFYSDGIVVNVELPSDCKYTAITQNLLVGCYQTTAGVKGRFFTGDIFAFDVYGEALDETVVVNKMYEAAGIVPCAGITLGKTEIVFTEAGSQTLIATVQPNNCNAPIVWNTSNKYIAVVDNGVVTAVADGSATITATCGAYSASCEVTVSGVAVGTEIYKATNIDVSAGNVDTGVKLCENDTDFTIVYKATIPAIENSGYLFKYNNTTICIRLASSKYVRTNYYAVYDYDVYLPFVENTEVTVIATHAVGSGYCDWYVLYKRPDGSDLWERFRLTSDLEAGLPGTMVVCNNTCDTVDEFTMYNYVVDESNDIYSGMITDEPVWTTTAAYSINQSGVRTGANYVTTYMEIPDGATKVTLKNVNDSTFTWQGVAQYDSTGAFISYIEGKADTTEIVVTLNSAAKYVKFSACPSAVATDIPATGLAVEFA